MPDNYMMHPQPQRPHRWTFDRTVNIPTLLTIASMVAAISVVGFRFVNEHDLRLAEVDRRMDGIERKAESAIEQAEAVTAVQAAQDKAQSAQMQVLRNEFRDDLRGINSKLDQLLLNQAGVKIDNQGWARQ
jgi:uncharacterized protein (DUF1684 family)